MRRITIRPWWTSAALIIVFMLALAADGLAAPYPTFYRGVRPLGMGGAFTALADDENALFYNPAGLASTQHLNVELFNPLVEISGKSLQLIDDAQNVDFDDTGDVSDLLDEHIGDHQHLRAAVFPNVGFQVANVGVMIGVLAQAAFDAEIRNPPWPEAHIDYVQDLALVGGVGFGIPITGLRLGAGIKIVQRTSLVEIYSAADIANEDFEDQIQDDLESGTGVSLDVGAMYSLPFLEFLNPEVALVIQNLPRMDMGPAKDMKTQANLGLSVQKSIAKFKLIGTLDYHDLTMSYDQDSDIAKRLHLGLEFKTPFFVSVRTGFNQGYWTAGATADFRVFRLDLATYAEEVGAYAGQRRDQRYVGQISFGW